MTVPLTWPAFIEATDRVREAAQALSRLIADTLNAQYAGAAAYLVLEDNDCCDVLTLHSVLDADGRTLFDFGDGHTRLLPALPQHSPLAEAWGSLDPADPRALFKAVQGLHQAGSLFDQLPDDLPFAEGPDPEDSYCLLLSTAARPDCWDVTRANASRMLRPYSAPLPAAQDDSARSIPPTTR
ncbi:hypothetical protein ACFYPC_35545 [Streptomyces sp. NPDC005808]|uniref:hypothetical protein n=1 Tax=Streptomyces sp. NPDC005808 TaxID=3364734 RepID=UPI00367CA93F